MDLLADILQYVKRLVDKHLVLKDIVIVISNGAIYDPRINKIVNSLNKKYSILVLGWNRQKFLIKAEREFPTDLKLFKISAPYGKASLISNIPLLIYLPLFWIWVFFNLVIHRPRVIHACNLDTVLPCLIYKLISKRKLVFDVFDRYAMCYISPKLSLLYSFVNYCEEVFACISDVLINVSDHLLTTFKKRPEECVTIMNCPGELKIEQTKKTEFTIIFPGHIRKHRGLEVLLDVIGQLDGVRLIVAGEILDRELFHKVSNTPNTSYCGLLRYAKILSLERSSHAIIALYDLEITLNRFAVPNKLFESMMCGIPIITNICQKIVRETNCGLIAEYNNPAQLRSCIIALRDYYTLRETLGNNGIIAFHNKYNWKIMEDRLYAVYNKIIK